MAGGRDFNKRLADVFGALDKYEPSKTTSASLDDQKAAPKQQQHPSRKHPRDDDPDQPSQASEDSPVDETESHSVSKQPPSSRRDHHTHPSRSSKRPRLDDRGRHGSSTSGPRRDNDRGKRGSHHVPGYHKNPQKWTDYDLSEDGTSSLGGLSSEQINKRAAFELLNELKSKRSETQSATADSETMSSDPSKITFKKPRKVSQRTSDDVARRSHDVARGSHDVPGGSHDHMELSHDHASQGGGGAGVVKMPEYEVGSKQAVPRKRKLLAATTSTEAKQSESTANKTKVVSLSHLQDNDEEERDEEI